LLLVRVPVGESVLQFDVPELVERARLSQDSPLVGIAEVARR
jgi:hypothetical protein